jgi:hypothetical protein
MQMRFSVHTVVDITDTKLHMKLPLTELVTLVAHTIRHGVAFTCELLENIT